MESLSRWWEQFAQSLSESLSGIADYLPILAAAVAVMVSGWIIARVVRFGLLRSGSAVSRLLERTIRAGSASRVKLSRRLLSLVANFVFWIIILLFAAMAASVAGLDAFAVWLNRVVDYLPTLAAGVLIALAGYLLSALVRDIVSTTLVSMGTGESEFAGLAAQTAVFLTALVIGLDQIGIDVTFLIMLVAVVVGGALLSMAFAFGFGARDFVGNLIAAQQLKGTLEPGDHARIADVEGRVLEVTPTAVVLVNERGRCIVPASYLQRQPTSIRPADADE